MKKLLFFLVCLLVLSCSDDEVNVDEVIDEMESVENLDIDQEILKLVNEYRASKNLNPLSFNTTANKLAKEHTEYMIAIESINHDNYEMRFDELKSSESATSFAENVAKYYVNAEAVVEGWISSDGHRANIEGNYTLTGISSIKDSEGKYYFTQIFFK